MLMAEEGEAEEDLMRRWHRLGVSFEWQLGNEVFVMNLKGDGAVIKLRLNIAQPCLSPVLTSVPCRYELRETRTLRS